MPEAAGRNVCGTGRDPEHAYLIVFPLQPSAGGLRGIAFGVGLTYAGQVDRFDSDSQSYIAAQGRLCAFVKWSPFQRWAYPAGLALFAAVCAWRPYQAWLAATYTLALLFFCMLLVRLLAMLLSILRDPALGVSPAAVSRLTDAELPVYSVLVPLFREPAVVPSLVTALTALDYPAEKLDIQLLVEPNDAQTLTALERAGLPGHMRVTVSPGGAPQTKPRACNAGLALATGEYLVVFDAEDRPDPDQLKKAYVAYRSEPERVVCLQARLDHYNSRQSFFARWSAMEYLIWFHLFLPGLQCLGAPLPLGGTSNHFRTRALRALGGWDPFNVTEDCDLGMRIVRRGWSTRMLDSTTWEEAVVGLGAWLRQRTRWIKGYWQTWLVQSRAGALRRFGLRRWAFFSLLVGGGPLMLAVNPILWSIILAWLLVGWPLADFSNPLSLVALAVTLVLFAANAVFVFVNMLGCLLCRRPDLVVAALFSPLEWVLLSFSAWRAIWQFFIQPFHWEKTRHGHGVAEDRPPRARPWLLRAGVPVLSFGVALAVLGGLARFVARRLEAQARAQRPVQLPARFESAAYASAALLYGPARADLSAWHVTVGTATNPVTGFAASVPDGVEQAVQIDASFPGTLCLWSKPDADWSAFMGLQVRLFVPADAPRWMHAQFYLRDRETLWYEHESPQELIPGKWTRFEVSLWRGTRDWVGRGHGKPWDGYTAQRVREFGIRLFGARPYEGPIYLGPIRGIPPARRVAETVRVTSSWRDAGPIRCYERFELGFELSREYVNPFDPAVVDVRGHFFGPDGVLRKVPAFFYQGYTRARRAGKEVLTPVGRAEWRIRFTPVQAGTHRYQIVLRDAHGARLRTEPGSFEAIGSDDAGFLRISGRDSSFLEFDNGEFYYPIGHNLCVPADPMPAFEYDFELPVGQRTYAYDAYLARMSEEGENWARIWMVPWWAGLEGRADWPGFHGVGRYNLANAWRLDHVLETVEKKGIYVQLTTQHKSEYQFRQSWRHCQYNVAQGGPCEKPADFFTNPEARRAYRNRLRYLVARWGYSTHILAWELWGEVDLVPGFTPKLAADWHREMWAHLRALDPWDHLVFTHCISWKRSALIWRMPEVQCIQANGYIRSPNTSLNHTKNFRGYLRDVKHLRKPVFIAEFGGRSELGAPSADYMAAQLHSGIWASFASELSGVAMHWWWDFIHGADLYGHYGALVKFSKGIDRIEQTYRPSKVIARDPDFMLRAVGMRARGQAFYWIHHRAIFRTLEGLPVVERGTVVISDLSPGEYRLEYWDTLSGEIVGQETCSVDGVLRLRLPPVHGDLALKAVRVRE